MNRWLSDVSRAAIDRSNVLGVLRLERRALEELDRMPASYTDGRLKAARERIAETIGQLEERER